MMIRPLALLVCAAMALAACEQAAPARLGPDGRPLPQLYRITPAGTAQIQLRMADSVNALRRARQLQTVQLNAELTAAAATHARDISVQNRPWHFGSDGSSPIDRARRAGYPGTLMGELISETFETELETLAAWMEDPDTRAIIMEPGARDLGFALHQDPNGKIWWVMTTGAPTFAPASVAVASFTGR